MHQHVVQYPSSVSEDCGVTATHPPTCPRFACNLPLSREDDLSPAMSSLRVLELWASFEGINLWCDLELAWEFSCPGDWAGGFPSTVASSPVALLILLQSHLQTTLRSSSHLRVHWNKMSINWFFLLRGCGLACRGVVPGTIRDIVSNWCFNEFWVKMSVGLVKVFNNRSSAADREADPACLWQDIVYWSMRLPWRPYATLVWIFPLSG